MYLKKLIYRKQVEKFSDDDSSDHVSKDFRFKQMSAENDSNSEKYLNDVVLKSKFPGAKLSKIIEGSFQDENSRFNS